MLAELEHASESAAVLTALRFGESESRASALQQPLHALPRALLRLISRNPVLV